MASGHDRGPQRPHLARPRHHPHRRGTGGHNATQLLHQAADQRALNDARSPPRSSIGASNASPNAPHRALWPEQRRPTVTLRRVGASLSRPHVHLKRPLRRRIPVAVDGRCLTPSAFQQHDRAVQRAGDPGQIGRRGAAPPGLDLSQELLGDTYRPGQRPLRQARLLSGPRHCLRLVVEAPWPVGGPFPCGGSDPICDQTLSSITTESGWVRAASGPRKFRVHRTPAAPVVIRSFPTLERFCPWRKPEWGG